MLFPLPVPPPATSTHLRDLDAWAFHKIGPEIAGMCAGVGAGIKLYAGPELAGVGAGVDVGGGAGVGAEVDAGGGAGVGAGGTTEIMTPALWENCSGDFNTMDPKPATVLASSRAVPLAITMLCPIEKPAAFVATGSEVAPAETDELSEVDAARHGSRPPLA